MKHRESPKETRERMRFEEIKKNPTGTLNDGFNRTENGSLGNLGEGIGWKGIGILILVLFIGFVIYQLLF
ncbi:MULTISPECIES: DUF6366 family protein [Ureibacillus]|jgi:hypothetical protein|uniref:DUF6366 family protein n=1 Tax=Ureibacillus TaxID=160795 RepID=UPI0002E5EF35|nr:DUF6366 family protein [Ureibacillus thermosphaericus]